MRRSSRLRPTSYVFVGLISLGFSSTVLAQDIVVSATETFESITSEDDTATPIAWPQTNDSSPPSSPSYSPSPAENTDSEDVCLSEEESVAQYSFVYDAVNDRFVVLSPGEAIGAEVRPAAEEEALPAEQMAGEMVDAALRYRREEEAALADLRENGSIYANDQLCPLPTEMHGGSADLQDVTGVDDLDSSAILTAEHYLTDNTKAFNYARENTTAASPAIRPSKNRLPLLPQPSCATCCRNFIPNNFPSTGLILGYPVSSLLSCIASYETCCGKIQSKPGAKAQGPLQFEPKKWTECQRWFQVSVPECVGADRSSTYCSMRCAAKALLDNPGETGTVPLKPDNNGNIFCRLKGPCIFPVSANKCLSGLSNCRRFQHCRDKSGKVYCKVLGLF